MKIISKIKDYYDYLQDWSDDIVFVRKNPYCMNDWRDVFCHFPYQYFYNFSNKDQIEARQILMLRVGFKVYFFRAQVFCNKDVYVGHFWIPYDDRLKYNIEYIGSRLDYNYSNVDEPIKWFCLRDVLKVNRKNQFVEEDVLNINLNNIKMYEWRIDRYAIDSHTEIEYHTPYLANIVSAYIDAEDIYRSLDDFLRAALNDKNCDSKGITDIEKIINHGFDKKSSFRNVH